MPDPKWPISKSPRFVKSDSPIWKFSEQADKLGYVNNPNFTTEANSPQDHEPCGYWHKNYTPSPTTNYNYYPAIEVFDSLLSPTVVGLLVSTTPRSFAGPFVYVPLSVTGLTGGSAYGMRWTGSETGIEDFFTNKGYDANRPTEIDLGVTAGGMALYEVPPISLVLPYLYQYDSIIDECVWASDGGSIEEFAYSSDASPGNAPFQEAIWLGATTEELSTMEMVRMRKGVVDYTIFDEHEIEFDHWTDGWDEAYNIPLSAYTNEVDYQGYAYFANSTVKTAAMIPGGYDPSYTACYDLFSTTELNYLLIADPPFPFAGTGRTQWHRDYTVTWAGWADTGNNAGNGKSYTEWALAINWWKDDPSERYFRDRSYLNSYKQEFYDAKPSYPDVADYPYQEEPSYDPQPYLAEVRVNGDVYVAATPVLDSSVFYYREGFNDLRYYDTLLGPMVITTFQETDANWDAVAEKYGTIIDKKGYLFIDHNRGTLEQDLQFETYQKESGTGFLELYKVPDAILPAEALAAGAIYSYKTFRLIKGVKT